MITTRILLSLFLFTLLASCSPMAEKTTPSAQQYHLLVGTYTSGTSEGIYVFRFDPQKGSLTAVDTAQTENPSFLTLGPDNSHVYAVNEVSGDKTGSVSAFRYDARQGKLRFVNQQPSGGGDPCYLNISPDGNYLLVANYTGGSIGVLPLQDNGALEAPVQVIQHQGSSINPQRQEKAHVHSVVISPDERHLLAGDLGTDKVNAYTFSSNKQQPLQPATPAFTAIEAGRGPRHLIFGKEGNYVYLVQELTGSVGVYRYNEGQLEHVQTISMTAPGFNGEVSGAELKLSPDGKFLYASNRGDANEIVVFAVNETNGNLQLVERQPSGGKTPRNFMIDPTGQWLLVAHQNSDTIVVFKRDSQSGKLTPTDTSIAVGKPVYLMMVPIED